MRSYSEVRLSECKPCCNWLKCNNRTFIGSLSLSSAAVTELFVTVGFDPFPFSAAGLSSGELSLLTNGFRVADLEAGTFVGFGSFNFAAEIALVTRGAVVGSG